jgi:hypothetical protein
VAKDWNLGKDLAGAFRHDSVGWSRGGGMTAKRAVIGLYLFAAFVTACVFARYQWEAPERMDFVSIYRGASLGLAAYRPDIDGIDNLYFLYPPPALLLSAALETLPYVAALVIFPLFSLALLARAMRPYGPAWLALFGPAVFVNLAFGQLGILMSALWLFAFSGHAWAGALLTIKPNFGFLYLFEAVRQRTALKVSLIVIGAALAVTLVWGWALWPAWIRANADFSAAVHAQRFNFDFLNVGPLYPFGPLGWGVMAIAAATCLLRRFDLLSATLAAPIVAPYLLVYDLVAVCAVTGAALYNDWDRLTSVQRATLALAFMAPCYAALAAWIAPVILLATLVLHALPARSDEPRKSSADEPVDPIPAPADVPAIR